MDTLASKCQLYGVHISSGEMRTVQARVQPWKTCKQALDIIYNNLLRNVPICKRVILI